MAFGHRVTETSMTVDNSPQSLTAPNPPCRTGPRLTGLWWDAKGDWTLAHASAQQDDGPRVVGARYLHRMENDEVKAACWPGRTR
jgi:hypothetical protein